MCYSIVFVSVATDTNHGTNLMHVAVLHLLRNIAAELRAVTRFAVVDIEMVKNLWFMISRHCVRAK